MSSATVALSPGRQIQAIGLMGFSHFFSHFYMFVLPPLFPLLHDELGISYVALGAIVTVYFVATGSLQTPCGIAVDRIGARKILIAGLFINAAAVMLAGFTSSYWALLVLFFMAGVGNAVFHPADYSILSASVDQKMLGRAFSVHSFGGSAGMALAPPTMLLLNELWGWRAALAITGAVGIVLAALVWLWGDVLRDHATGAAGKKSKPFREQLDFLLSREVVLMFLFFLVSSAGGTGISVFCVSALVELYKLSIHDANWLFTMFMILSSVGVIAGGFLADRTRRHDLVLVVTYAVSTITICAVGLGTLSMWLLLVLIGISGLMRGVVNPSRDVMVRQAAPEGTVGTVFAWVTTGFSVGQGASPVVYGWFMDSGAPDWVFYVSGAFGILNIALVFLSRNRTL